MQLAALAEVLQLTLMLLPLSWTNHPEMMLILILKLKAAELKFQLKILCMFKFELSTSNNSNTNHQKAMMLITHPGFLVRALLP